MRSARLIILAISAIILSATWAEAMFLKIPNTFTGVPFFDRWGGCHFVGGSGYEIAESQKKSLRRFADTPIALYVSKIYMRSSPGTVRFDKIRVEGPAQTNDTPPADIGLTIKLLSQDHNRATVSVTIESRESEPLVLDTDSLSLLVATKKPEEPTPGFTFFFVADGPSFMIVNNLPLNANEKAPWTGASNYDSRGLTWSIRPSLPRQITLAPGKGSTFTIDLTFQPGEYDIIFTCTNRYQRPIPILSNKIEINAP